MKILVILSRFPYPLDKGDKLRAYNHIKYLSEKHEIILLALSDKNVEDKDIAHIKPFCKDYFLFKLSKISIFIHLIYALISGKPFQVGYFLNLKLKSKINMILKEHKPDHIYCQLIRVAEYAKNIKLSKTLDYQDAFSEGVKKRIKTVPFYLKPLFFIEYKRLVRYERKIFDKFDNKFIISNADKQQIQHKNADNIHIISNGINVKYFYPYYSQKKYDIVFTGNMSYPPNVQSVIYIVKEILPIVRLQKPDVSFLIAGAEPSKRVLKLASDKIVVTGWVEDIRECYASSRIFLAPMQIGTGLQNKILEAMAMHLPCITSELANTSIAAKEGSEVLIGRNPHEYAEHILKLLDQPDYSYSISVSGLNYVRSHFDWIEIVEKIHNIILSTNEN